MKTTEGLWNNQFSEEPYKPDKNKKDVKDFVCSFSYNILAASKRQQMFFYQVKK